MRCAALLLILAACWTPSPRASVPASDRYTAIGQRPTNAERATPPGGIDDQARAVGTAAPTGTARDSAGASWSIATALTAHPRLVVVFYRGDWCHFCRAQLAELSGQAAGFAQRDVGLVAVSVDSVDTSAHLAEGLHLAFPLISDPGHHLIEAFGVLDGETEIAWPAIFVIDHTAAGDQIAWRWLADTFRQRITTTDLLAALDALPPVAK